MTDVRSRTLLGLAALAVAVVIVAGTSERTAASPATAGKVWGTWVLALDATPYGIPGGFLPGLMTVHRDGTFTITDGGDIGSFPFTTTDTAQQGVWVGQGPRIRGTSLFLRKDETTGEVEGWHRVIFTLHLAADGNHLSGPIREEFLACDPAGPTPFKLLNCPDPIAGAFTVLGTGVGIEFTRLQVVR